MPRMIKPAPMINQHKPYKNLFRHQEDFKVSYKFRSEDNGGRKVLPNQGIRFDFYYEHENHEIKGYFMIYPEFEDANGNLITQGSVLRQGVARMWILNPKLRAYHQERIQKGRRGYFLEGHKRVADCEVIEIVDLMKNPIEVNEA